MLKLLLADDSIPSLAACQAMLEKMGHEVVLAHCGNSALAAACQQTFDMIFLDEYMPGASGAQVAQQLRHSRGPNALTPIISLSGVSSAQASQQWLACGMDAHLGKPVSAQALRQVLQDYAQMPAGAVDEAVMSGLLSDVGAAAFDKLLRLFLQELEMLSARLQQAEVDRETVAAVTHIWKNSAKLYGAHRLAEQAQILNDAPPADDAALSASVTQLLTLAKHTWKTVNHQLATGSAEQHKGHVS